MSYTFHVPVYKESEAHEVLTWAKKHCPSYITNDITTHNNLLCYGFYFGREEDYVWCTLRWS